MFWDGEAVKEHFCFKLCTFGSDLHEHDWRGPGPGISASKPRNSRQEHVPVRVQKTPAIFKNTPEFASHTPASVQNELQLKKFTFQQQKSIIYHLQADFKKKNAPSLRRGTSWEKCSFARLLEISASTAHNSHRHGPEQPRHTANNGQHGS